jgi:deazaflavin-dependent oxidoreductase (nitroreductase family)
MNEFNRAIIEEFRANDGKVGGPFEGAPVLLPTTIGAKSGESRTTPVMYLPDGERTAIFALQGGGAYQSGLVSQPPRQHDCHGRGRHRYRRGRCRRDNRRGARSSLQSPAEIYPQFTEYAQKTTRQIPVIALERKD